MSVLSAVCYDGPQRDWGASVVEQDQSKSSWNLLDAYHQLRTIYDPVKVPSVLNGASSVSCDANLSDSDSGCDQDLETECQQQTKPVLRKVASYPMKKRVQFADEVGQELAKIRVLSEPHDCCQRLDNGKSGLSSSLEFWRQLALSKRKWLKLKCEFEQPVCCYSQMCNAVRARRVSLSSLRFNGLSAFGCAAVQNLCFKKRVFARVTFDNWQTFADYEASYASSDSNVDIFKFTFNCPGQQAGDIELCICYEAELDTYWDNNHSSNYRISVLTVGNEPSDPADCSFF